MTGAFQIAAGRENRGRSYGPPQPFEPIPSNLFGMERAREVERRDKLMWAAIKKRLGVNHFIGVSWADIYRAKKELGYPLLPVEENWIRGLPPLKPAPGVGQKPTPVNGAPAPPVVEMEEKQLTAAVGLPEQHEFDQTGDEPPEEEQ
jgi:hypothetical protein